MRMHPRTLRALLLSLGLGTLLLAGVVWAGDLPWPKEAAPVNLSQSSFVRGITLDVGSEGRVVAWANRDDRRIHWTQNGGTGWTSPQMLAPTGDVWAPHLVLSDTTPFITWVEGAYPFPVTVYERELEGAAARSVMTDAYGMMTPKLTAGNGGLHLIFAAAESSANWDKGDLYYAFRPFTATTWAAPSAVVTRTQVVPLGVGGVWHPRLALEDSGTTLHVVWEQTVAGAGGDLHSVWHISGTWSPSGVTWGTPERLSPLTQEAVRPDVAVDGSGRVHVVWGELVGGDISRPAAQYVNYRRLDGGPWTPALRLDASPVLVNTINPTWIRPNLEARGDTLCVTWHGYRSDAIEEKEEVLLRCSTDGGHAWSPVVNCALSPAALSLFPVLALDTEQQVHLTWEEYQGGGDFFKDYDALYVTGPAEIFNILLPVIMRNA
jgi:hypothetical protein